MCFNSPISRFLFSAGLTMAFSCTIITDKDITSTAQLSKLMSKLKWKGLEIKQETSKGNSTVSAQVLYDSTVNIVDPATGTRINRRVRFSLGAMGPKLKLRSGTTAKTEFTLSYKEGNQPYTFVIYQGDSAVEIYRFRYDASNRLYRIMTFLNPVDGRPFILATRDSIGYDASFKPVSIIRRSPSQPGTITLTYNNSTLQQIGFKGTNYTQSGGNCRQGVSTPTCGGFSTNSNAQVHYQFHISNGISNQVLIQDVREPIGGGVCPACDREPATFYFHPLMLVKDQLPFGADLLLAYMGDWWVLGAATADPNQRRTNEVVTFNFLYGL